MPGHNGMAINLGPRGEHVHLFVADVRRLVEPDFFAAQREVGRAGAALPSGDIDVLMDDADHFRSTQLSNFELWFPKLRDGGLYIIEDVFVTPLPWRHHLNGPDRIPHNNTNCGSQCYFPQRPADHPFLADPPPSMRAALKDRSWFFTITGMHKGGGLDMMMWIWK